MADIRNTIFALNREQEEKHTEELAKKLELPYVSLLGYPLTGEVLSLIPEELAIEHSLVPYLKIGNTVKIGLAKPGESTVNEFLKQFEVKLKVKFTPSVISHSSLVYGISMYERIKTEEMEKVSEEEKVKEETFEDELNDLKSIGTAVKKVTVSKLLDVIILGATKTKSSDIHMEPGEKTFLIRYRIDGILQDVVTLPLAQHKQLVSRIKYLSKLRMDISDRPQDGRFSMNQPEGTLDLRVSLMPSTFGESIVLRLLGQEKSILRLDLLGFRPDALAIIKQAISKPYGMILTSGPTGSGKTSTLYAVLMELKKPGVKIISLENPVEYRIEGIEQSQINPDGGYDFADALRSSLRQDPDVLMVGEVRDPETAETAIEAALTGHLMLSTIHANSAPAVFARLLEIGIKPFLLSGSINLIMAQRLVRKLCPKCRKEYLPAPEVVEEIKKVLSPIVSVYGQALQKKLDENPLVLLKATGCAECNRTGFIGRQVIIEVLVPDEKVEGLIANKASIAEFEKASVEQGMITMEQDGLLKVLEGITTVEEVWRVTKQ